MGEIMEKVKGVIKDANEKLKSTSKDAVEAMRSHGEQGKERAEGAKQQVEQTELGPGELDWLAVQAH